MATNSSLVGSNLLDSYHPEQDFIPSATGLRTEIEYGAYLPAMWRR